MLVFVAKLAKEESGKAADEALEAAKEMPRSMSPYERATLAMQLEGPLSKKFEEEKLAEKSPPISLATKTRSERSDRRRDIGESAGISENTIPCATKSPGRFLEAFTGRPGAAELFGISQSAVSQAVKNISESSDSEEELIIPDHLQKISRV